MRCFSAASLAFFLTLSLGLTAQVRGMSASGSVSAGSRSGTHVGGTFSSPSIGFGRPGVPYHYRRYPRTFGYVSPYGPYYYGAYVPYATDYGVDPAYTGYVAGTFDTGPYSGYPYPPQYAPAPGYYSPDSSPPPVSSAPAPQSYQQRRGGQGSANDELAELTVLVFRDGHRQQVANYAIMGSTLFVLSGPRSRIPIAELDVPATEQVNQDRGVDFHVPVKAQ